MSQVSRNQNQNFFLKELIQSLNKNSVEPVSFDLSEDDFEILPSDNYCETIGESDTIEQLAKFCSNHLIKHTFEQLNDENFFQTISYHLYSASNSLLVQTPSDLEAKLASLLVSIDSIYDYLAKASQIKFESIDLFLLSTFHLYVHLCNHFKTQKQLSQRMSLSQMNSRPDARLSAQLIKASMLFESKIANLNEEKNKQNLIKLTKFLIYLVKNFKDAKSNVFVWKMVSKLCVKFKILLNNSNHLDSFCYKNGKFLLKKIFILIYEDQNLNLNYIKDSLNRLSLNEACRVSEMSSAIGSQMTLKNNIYLDTAKVIKLSAFLAKILKSFLALYFGDLADCLQNEFFDMLTALLSSVNSVLLTESRLNTQHLTIDTNQFDFQPNQFINLPKDYISIKLDFIKEFSSVYESLLQLIEANAHYANYMRKKNFFLEKLQQKNDESNESIFPNSQTAATPSQHDNIDDILLFYLIFINRTKVKLNDQNETKSNFDLVTSPAYLNEIFNLIELSTCMASYFLYNDHFLHHLDFGYLSTTNYEAKMFSRIELYDFVLVCLTRYILCLIDTNSNVEPVIFYLVNNLLMVNNLIDENVQNQKKVYHFYALRIQLSADLLISLAKWMLKSDGNENLVKFIKFLSQIYETNGSSTIVRHNLNLRFVLDQILHTCSQVSSKFQNIVSTVADFYINKRMSNCFNLILSYLSNPMEVKKTVFIVNTLAKANELFGRLIKLFVDKNKMPNEQIWMKKIIVFFDSNHFGEILGLIEDFFDQVKAECDTIVGEQSQKLLKIISQFLNLNEIANLSKYFDHFGQFKTEMSRKMDTNQLVHKQFSLNLENFKRIFQFICVSARVYASVCLRCSLKATINEEILFLLEFFIKNCSQNYEAKIGTMGDQEPTFLNIKLEASHFLRNLSKKEINETNIVKKVLELFGILLNDSSTLVKFFGLESLDEYSKTNESNNKIICQLSRSDKNLNDLILNYLVEISIDGDFDEIGFYLEKRNELIKRLQVHHRPKDDILTSQKMDEIEDCGSLDETMNAIMCAMDTTMSNQELKLDNDEKTHSSSKAQSILDGISGELDKVFDMYDNRSMPESIRTQLTNLVSKISSFI
ncbi:hypothetical protein BpHYR1_023718 [Brachionus plicatilis]|uniref:Uncharacterized protein n=1 Tax=Brachionus plicatilis TaxID=10195 RepID=A0A3M7RTP6_BRAPC|nr:hypothetical protein BpHYR1_023718 [Brachionus plicatilis]